MDSQTTNHPLPPPPPPHLLLWTINTKGLKCFKQTKYLVSWSGAVVLNLHPLLPPPPLPPPHLSLNCLASFPGLGTRLWTVKRKGSQMFSLHASKPSIWWLSHGGSDQQNLHPLLLPPPYLLPMSHIFTCPVSVPVTRKWPDTPSEMGQPSGSLHGSNCFTVPCQRNAIG